VGIPGPLVKEAEEPEKSFPYEQKEKFGGAVLRRLMWPEEKGIHTGLPG
jgi:hypothetical protein